MTFDLTELMNVSSNTVLRPDSHVIKRDSIGTEMYHDFVTLCSWPPERSFFMGQNEEEKFRDFSMQQHQFNVV